LIGDLKRQPTISGIVSDPSGDPTGIDTIIWLVSEDHLPGSTPPGRKYFGIFEYTKRTTLQVGGVEVLLKAFFGIGDFDYGFPLDSSKTPNANTSAMLSYNADALLLRGFKYGLLNAVPTSPNAVFRYDTFGQFRDMLEPRPQTRYFEDGKLGEPAVTIAFYDRDGTPGVKPSSTNAQNLSLFATSSVPYSDMPTSTFGRDRSTVQPDLDPSEDLEITTS
jgi:hypothetical protein